MPEKNNLVSHRAEATQAELQLARTLLSRSPNRKLVLLTSTRNGVSEGKGAQGLGTCWARAGKERTSQGLTFSTQEQVTAPPVFTGAGAEPEGLCLPCKCSTSKLHPSPPSPPDLSPELERDLPGLAS